MPELDPPRRALTFAARDGFALHGDLYQPAGTVQKAVLVAPAMAVHRGFYGAFASYLAQHGCAVLVPDYRGIGDSRPASLRGFRAELRDWAVHDLEGGLDALAALHPGTPICFVGHSIGGQLFGLLHAQRIERAMIVASQSGYHGHWPWPGRLRMIALWYAVIPGLSRALGFLPLGRITGGEEEVPRQVALDWTRWARNRQYMFVDGPSAPESTFQSFRGPLRTYAIMDDEFAPPASVEWLHAQFASAQRELRRVHPHDVGMKTIGHFPAFRPAFRETLWPEFRDYLSAR